MRAPDSCYSTPAMSSRRTATSRSRLRPWWSRRSTSSDEPGGRPCGSRHRRPSGVRPRRLDSTDLRQGCRAGSRLRLRYGGKHLMSLRRAAPGCRIEAVISAATRGQDPRDRNRAENRYPPQIRRGCATQDRLEPARPTPTAHGECGAARDRADGSEPPHPVEPHPRPRHRTLGRRRCQPQAWSRRRHDWPARPASTVQLPEPDELDGRRRTKEHARQAVWPEPTVHRPRR